MHWIQPHVALAPVPGRFSRVSLVAPGDPARAGVEAFIASVYLARYGARLQSFLPGLLAYYDDHDRLVAAVGVRGADDGALFCEQYVAGRLEHALASHGMAPARSELVEVGNFAAVAPGVARELIVQLAWLLSRAGRPWVLCVATQQLRNAFRRLGLDSVALAEARPERLIDPSCDWGQYYATHPQLICGHLAPARAPSRPVDEDATGSAVAAPLRAWAIA